MKTFGRVLTAMVTSFNNDGSVNIENCVAIANHLLDNGSDGLVVCGTTGENPTMSRDEKLALFNAIAKECGLLDGKTIYVTGSVCEEFCDGVNIKMFFEEYNLKPDYVIICEPSDNIITLGHKGKAQIKITTHGVSAHGSAPEK